MRTKKREDEKHNLILRIVSLEQRLACDGLGENAAHRPDVYRPRVFFCGQNHFRGSIPSRHDVVREVRVLLSLLKTAGEAEVADLQLAVAVDL